jgi:phosphatidyl-myo-inositol dimannoside synthase
MSNQIQNASGELPETSPGSSSFVPSLDFPTSVPSPDASRFVPSRDASRFVPSPDAGRAKHLLVTNDFPPKIGGIQSYLWELWRRFPAGSAEVLTTPYAGTSAFDAAAPLPITRTKQSWMAPTRGLRQQIVAHAKRMGTDFVLLDPALPMGWLGPQLRAEGIRYGVILHGAEVTVPGRLPLVRSALAKVLNDAELVIAAGGYPLAEGEHAIGRKLPSIVIPPGVDIERFVPFGASENSEGDAQTRSELRRGLGLPVVGPLIVCTSRLVPRKGFDTVIAAAGQIAAEFGALTVAISGGGRDRERLERKAQETMTKHSQLDVRFLGRTTDEQLVQLLQAGDVHAMICRNRWGGLEQEGFGIVFLEAAACGTPQVAGASGGSAEAVVDGETGLVVANPKSASDVASAMRTLLNDPTRRANMAVAGRKRVVNELTYDILASELHDRIESFLPR